LYQIDEIKRTEASLLVSLTDGHTYRRPPTRTRVTHSLIDSLLSLLLMVCRRLRRASAAEHDDHRRRQRDGHQRCINEMRHAMDRHRCKQYKKDAADVRDGTHHTRQLTITHKHTSHIISLSSSHTACPPHRAEDSLRNTIHNYNVNWSVFLLFFNITPTKVSLKCLFGVHYCIEMSRGLHWNRTVGWLWFHGILAR